MNRLNPLHRRRLLAACGYLFLFAVTAAALADHLGAFGYQGDDWAEFDRIQVKVERVIDPITLEVRAGKRVQTIRLLGVQPPAAAVQWAQAHLASAITGRTVRLKLEPVQPRDISGRVMAYVFLSDDDNLNFDLIRDGYARADRQRDHTMRSMFELAESLARKSKRGIWGED